MKHSILHHSQQTSQIITTYNLYSLGLLRAQKFNDWSKEELFVPLCHYAIYRLSVKTTNNNRFRNILSSALLFFYSYNSNTRNYI